jgi:hypothetical protein
LSENLYSREEEIPSGFYPESQQRGAIKSLGDQSIRLISAFQQEPHTPSNVQPLYQARQSSSGKKRQAINVDL